MSVSSPRISVVIPAYNQAAYLLEAIQSVINQTCPDFELVVVDDGSTDETPQILAEINDPRVRVVRQPNAGLSAARNTGIRESSAPLITLLDSDDFFMLDKLAILGDYLDDHPEIGMVSGGFQMVDTHSKPFGEVVKQPGKLNLPDLLFFNPFTPSAVMFRREWTDRVGVFDENLRAVEDMDLWLRMASAGCKFAWVERLVAAYRFHLGQMTRESSRMRKAIFTMLEKFFAQPNLPDDLAAMKDIVHASALIHTAAYAYHAREYDRAQQDLTEASRLDPRLSENHFEGLVKRLLGWANDPRSHDPIGFLEQIYSHPPSGMPGFQRQLRHAMSDVLMGPLFTLPRDNLRGHRKELIQAIRYKPAWLFNRGVLRMLSKVLL